MKDDRGDLDLTKQIEDLQRKVREAEGELSIIKGIGQNSPEMKTLKKENEELKAELARAREDHQDPSQLQLTQRKHEVLLVDYILNKK